MDEQKQKYFDDYNDGFFIPIKESKSLSQQDIEDFIESVLKEVKIRLSS